MSHPEIQQREAVDYAAIPVQVTMEEMTAALPRLWPEVHAWLSQRGARPAGAPFIRYLTAPPGGEWSIEIGIPAFGEISSDDRVVVGSFPAGRYAVMVHTGPYEGLGSANAELQAWAASAALTFQLDDTAQGSVWRNHSEFYLTDPGTEPDPAKWQTEIVYLLAD